jgi:hypothetical protein
MTGNNDLPILPFLTPAVFGMPSRRHFVVMRRAEQHFSDALEIFEEGLTKPALSDAEISHLSSKIFLVVSSIEELERWTTRAKRAEIASRLGDLKTNLEKLKEIIKEW